MSIWVLFLLEWAIVVGGIVFAEYKLRERLRR